MVGNFTTGRLLGDQNQIVADLLQRLADLRDGQEVARVVVLGGESGAGKSRIIREVYEQLRLSQSGQKQNQGYWPALEASDLAPVPFGDARPAAKS